MKLTKRVASILITALFTLTFILPSNAIALELTVSGNGSGSSNEVNVTQEAATNIQQDNSANVANNIQVSSNTGENSANDNSENVQIETGNAETNINAENSLNNSQVNVDGCCDEGLQVKITGNGDNSENKINIDSSINTNVQVNNSANLENNIGGSVNTGRNLANDNKGNVSIKSGNIKVKGQVKNGPINFYNVHAEAGNSANQSYLISSNGKNSKNALQSNLQNDTQVFLMSYADIDNVVNFDLNTGENTANDNLGDVQIETGDVLFEFLIKNDPVNIGGVDIDTCCDVDDPGDPGGGGDGDNGGNGGNEGNGNGDNGNGGDGQITPQAASTSAGGNGVQVIGLSDTTSPQATALFFWVGIVMIFLGLKFIGEEYFPESQNKSSNNQ